MNELNTLGQRLKYALIERGWTHKELAQYCKIQETMIYRYIKGINRPLKRTAIKIGAGLDIPVKWLLNGEGRFEDGFDIHNYSSNTPKKVRIEKSVIDGYDLTFNISESEVKEIILATIK
jgi:transcriptional regulator with XRE-family HTH domain